LVVCLCCALLLQARRSRHRAKRRRPPWHSKQPPFRVLLLLGACVSIGAAKVMLAGFAWPGEVCAAAGSVCCG
jgi:hypothetical protein